MTQTNSQVVGSDAIERRIDRGIVGTIAVDPRRGMAVDSMGQALEVAKLMSVSGCAVPRHLRNNPGACLAVAIQGWEWSINPFAIANKSYEVNDRLGYESALYQAVVTKRAPIKGRMRYTFSGEGETRQCKVTAELSDGGGTVDYESPKFSRIQPKNSPLWKNDPDQQLIYYSVRAFARRHFADVMMGIQTVDELQDNPEPSQVPAGALPQTKAARILEGIANAPVSEGQTFVPDDPAAGEAQSFTIPPVVAPDPVSGAAQDTPAETVDQQTGEVTDSHASGADADPAGRPLETHEAMVNALNEAAIDANASSEAPGKFLAAYALAKGVKGKIDKQTPAWRAECVKAFEDHLLAK